MRVAQIQKGGQDREGKEEGTVSTNGEGREEFREAAAFPKTTGA